MREPYDREDECNAHLYIGDNYGDNHATMRCQLPKGHTGAHREKYTVFDNKVVIYWDKDERDWECLPFRLVGQIDPPTKHSQNQEEEPLPPGFSRDLEGWERFMALRPGTIMGSSPVGTTFISKPQDLNIIHVRIPISDVRCEKPYPPEEPKIDITKDILQEIDLARTFGAQRETFKFFIEFEEEFCEVDEDLCRPPTRATLSFEYDRPETPKERVSRLRREAKAKERAERKAAT